MQCQFVIMVIEIIIAHNNIVVSFAQNSGALASIEQVEQLPLPSDTVQRARVSSAYIRQMTDENLLIPGKYLNLLDTIGQGIIA